MVNFGDMLKQELSKLDNNNSNSNVEYPSNSLKHEQLYFNKDNDKHVVRILPNVGDKFFAHEFREIFLSATNRNGKKMNLNVVIGADQTPDNSPFLAQLVQWQQEKRVPNTYNKEAFPSKRYYVNAVRIVQNAQNQPVMETDENGQLVVRLLKLPTSAYQAILSKLQDPLLQPNESDEFGFIGVKNALPISIAKPAPGGMSYSVDVYQRFELGPLPQGWEELAEDLAYQATPTEHYNKEFLDYFIDVVNGVEGQNSGSNNQQQAQLRPSIPNQNQFQNTQQQQAPQQNQSVADMNIPMDYTQSPRNQQQQSNQQQSTPPVQQSTGGGAGVGDQNFNEIADVLSKMKQGVQD